MDIILAVGPGLMKLLNIFLFFFRKEIYGVMVFQSIDLFEMANSSRIHLSIIEIKRL